jgi:hypothetical protein
MAARAVQQRISEGETPMLPMPAPRWDDLRAAPLPGYR